MSDEIRVVLYGIGALGKRLAEFALEKPGLRVVGAVDIAHVGEDLGAVLSLRRRVGVTVTADLDAVLAGTEADLVIHATSSYLRDTYPQLLQCVNAGLNVVSTCEELSYPLYKYPEMTGQLDSAATKRGVTIIGTGINPGYLMDKLPLTLTGPCTHVEKITVTRLMYSGDRRSSFQKKIGTGLSQADFDGLIASGQITGHVGLIESIALLADALGWTLDEIQELPPEAVISDQEVSTTFTTIKPGHIAGLKSVAVGMKDGEAVVTLEFISHALIAESMDSIVIDGEPPIHETIRGGVHGDTGTIAMVFNIIPKVLNARPGLLTMKDLPVYAALGDLRRHIHT
jgi:4-hydroxy-tetrahydrodipicolinate reductase